MEVPALLLTSLFFYISQAGYVNAFPMSPDYRSQSAADASGSAGGPSISIPRPKPVECAPTGWYHFSDESTCDSYILCQEGNKTIEQCPSGSLYDHSAANDEIPCYYTKNTICVLPIQLCPSEYHQHLPHPDNRNKFYECRRGEGYLRQCPEKLLYNPLSPNTRYPCDYPENVHYEATPPSPLPPPSTPSPQQKPKDHEPDEPKKIFNFYSYVTNNW